MQLDTIYIPKSVFDSEDRWEIVDSLSDFATSCIRDGGYVDDEIPREVMMNSQVTAVWSQIYRNGSLGYIHNSVLNGFSVDPARPYQLKQLADEGFEAIGAGDHRALLRRIWAFFEQNRALLEVAHSTNRWRELPQSLKTQTSEIDREWFGRNSEETEDEFLIKRVSWIKSLHNVRALDPEQLASELKRLFEANPNRTERLERLKAVLEARQEVYAQDAAKSAHAKKEMYRRAFHPTLAERVIDIMKKLVRK